MFSSIALVAALLSQALPALAVLHEQLASLPTGWTATSAADSDLTLAFTVALTQQNIDQLESKLLSVSTPGSAAYGQHMDVSDVEAFFAPTAGASEAVESWLKRCV
jgi:tripeptidyl-peptidase-1